MTNKHLTRGQLEDIAQSISYMLKAKHYKEAMYTIQGLNQLEVVYILHLIPNVFDVSEEVMSTFAHAASLKMHDEAWFEQVDNFFGVNKEQS